MKEEQVWEAMAPITRYVYELMPSFTTAGYALFFIIFALSALVYYLGFARKLKLWQNVVIYLFLSLGCLILTFLAFFLPITEGLIVAALILIIYKFRRMSDDRNEQKDSTPV